jgi:hypothetical protein
MSFLLSLLGVIVMIVGGVVLLVFESSGSTGYSLGGHNVFEAVTHGVGLYCVGRGLFAARLLGPDGPPPDPPTA